MIATACLQIGVASVNRQRFILGVGESVCCGGALEGAPCTHCDRNLLRRTLITSLESWLGVTPVRYLTAERWQ